VQPDDIVLGFFSFAKFLMYRDLDPGVWPQGSKITERPLIRSLLSDGFHEPDDLVPEEEPIDPRIAPSDMLHIVDSDSSQTLAVHEVRRAAHPLPFPSVAIDPIVLPSQPVRHWSVHSAR
jgi:hypothetical protein